MVWGGHGVPCHELAMAIVEVPDEGLRAIQLNSAFCRLVAMGKGFVPGKAIKTGHESVEIFLQVPCTEVLPKMALLKEIGIVNGTRLPYTGWVEGILVGFDKVPEP